VAQDVRVEAEQQGRRRLLLLPGLLLRHCSPRAAAAAVASTVAAAIATAIATSIVATLFVTSAILPPHRVHAIAEARG
jgi:hypothetical protein